VSIGIGEIDGTIKARRLIILKSKVINDKKYSYHPFDVGIIKRGCCRAKNS
jgi:hypothetical protein